MVTLVVVVAQMEVGFRRRGRMQEVGCRTRRRIHGAYYYIPESSSVSLILISGILEDTVGDDALF
jgi:hypothetical protein